MSNIGRVIRDNYCNGYADRNYDMDGAIIVHEGCDYIVAIKTTGQPILIDFGYYDRIDDKRKSMDKDEIQRYIDNWSYQVTTY